MSSTTYIEFAFSQLYIFSFFKNFSLFYLAVIYLLVCQILETHLKELNLDPDDRFPALLVELVGFVNLRDLLFLSLKFLQGPSKPAVPRNENAKLYVQLTRLVDCSCR